MVRLTDRPDMTLDVYGGRKATMQQQQQQMQNEVVEGIKGLSRTYVCTYVRS